MTKGDALYWLARLQSTLATVGDRLDYLKNELEQTSEAPGDPLDDDFQDEALDVLESAKYWNGIIGGDLQSFREDMQR